MKIFVLFLLIISCAFTSLAQTDKHIFPKQFNIDGTITGRDTGLLILMYVDTLSQWRKDTMVLNNGSFNFKGWIKEPSYAHLIGSKRDGNYSSFYIEPKNLQVLLEENKFDKIIVKGSYAQSQYDSLNHNRVLLEAELKQLKDILEDSTNSTSNFQKSELSRRTDSVNSELNALSVNFINTHPDSYVSVKELYSILMSPKISSFSYDSINTIFNNLSNKIKNSHVGKIAAAELRKMELTKINNPAPDFTLQSLKGQNVSLSNYQGGYVLLDFWASSCVPCRVQIKEQKKLYESYREKGLKLIFISTDKNVGEWKKAIADDGILNWIHVIDNGERESQKSNLIGEVYFIKSIPHQVLVDKNGIIIGRTSDTNIEQQLKDIFETN